VTPSSETPSVAAPRDDRAVRVVLVGFAVYLVGIAVLALISPHTFFEKVGPFGSSNAHYTRDGATFELALGAGAAVAVFRQSWRVPLLATMALQSLLHAINHLSDIGNAHPKWLGPFDFGGLAIGTVVLTWALVRARRQVAQQ
jgi:hypothetical protein